MTNKKETDAGLENLLNKAREIAGKVRTHYDLNLLNDVLRVACKYETIVTSENEEVICEGKARGLQGVLRLNGLVDCNEKCLHRSQTDKSALEIYRLAHQRLLSEAWTDAESYVRAGCPPRFNEGAARCNNEGRKKDDPSYLLKPEQGYARGKHDLCDDIADYVAEIRKEAKLAGINLTPKQTKRLAEIELARDKAMVRDYIVAINQFLDDEKARFSLIKWRQKIDEESPGFKSQVASAVKEVRKYARSLDEDANASVTMQLKTMLGRAREIVKKGEAKPRLLWTGYGD